MNYIRHNSPSPIQCLRAFHILFFAYLLFRCYCYNHYKTQKYYFCYCYRYFHITLLLNTLLQIISYPGVVELTTQLLILENILWLPLCRINKFGLNTLSSKTVWSPILMGYKPPKATTHTFKLDIVECSHSPYLKPVSYRSIHITYWNQLPVQQT